jgi:hypothetical protein
MRSAHTPFFGVDIRCSLYIRQSEICTWDSFVIELTTTKEQVLPAGEQVILPPFLPSHVQ